jgi:hypothetical protein
MWDKTEDRTADQGDMKKKVIPKPAGEDYGKKRE